MATMDGIHRVENAVTAELLVDIAVGLGQSRAEHRLPAGTTRRWVLALETDAYEAWVIVWPPGSGLDLHDHAGSWASLYIVNGRLRERYVAADGSLVVRWLNAGDSVAMAPDHQHEMINLGADEVVSIHVYSPRLADQSFRETKSFT